MLRLLLFSLTQITFSTYIHHLPNTACVVQEIIKGCLEMVRQSELFCDNHLSTKKDFII